MLVVFISGVGVRCVCHFFLLLTRKVPSECAGSSSPPRYPSQKDTRILLTSSTFFSLIYFLVQRGEMTISYTNLAYTCVLPNHVREKSNLMSLPMSSLMTACAPKPPKDVCAFIFPVQYEPAFADRPDAHEMTSPIHGVLTRYKDVVDTCRLQKRRAVRS